MFIYLLIYILLDIKGNVYIYNYVYLLSNLYTVRYQRECIYIYIIMFIYLLIYILLDIKGNVYIYI